MGDLQPSAPLYPSLDAETPSENFRLQSVTRLRSQLEREIETRAGLYKKYHRTVNILDGVDTGATATGIVLGGIGAGLLATIIAAPAVPVILGLSATCGLLSAVTKFINRRFRLKAQKHDQIRVLAESKLNSITKLVSKALEDETISHSEFQLLVSEVERYNEMKKAIQTGAKKKVNALLDEATKGELIERGRKEAHQLLLQKLVDGSSQ